MICAECRLAEATGSRGIVTKELPDGPTQHTTQRLCRACFDAIQAHEALDRAATQERVRVAFADGSAFAQMRADLAAVIARGIASELANAAEYLDFMATAQPTPLPDDLRVFADQHRPATPASWIADD